MQGDDSDEEEEDGIIDVDAEGVVPAKDRVQKGLLSSLPGGQRINHKELADMEDIDWCVGVWGLWAVGCG